ncbi:MAG: beta-3-deoxy-D-manno-oct-2-ulosonic acid transferase [Burkholderiales bacterium PBB6]|nr:MAG: beta-3-deoxy-D-manno-oct-2-ulosonic acid transferase [Burkholderiales bacterium PBB6]
MSLPRWLLHGPGLAGLAPLPALLNDAQLVRASWRTAFRKPPADAVLAWGLKPSAARAAAYAQAHGLPLLRLEDGFLRSVGLGPDDPPCSVVLDDLGIYYDARQPSRLERLISEGVTPLQAARARALQQAWCSARISKYNAARDDVQVHAAGAVLVVDQTHGDASVLHGQANTASFQRMLAAALAEHPQRRVILKVHPDVVAGRKHGWLHMADLRAGLSSTLSDADAARVTLLATDAHPAGLLEAVYAVYVVTSQLGFEALLWGKPVRCFGMPFYAGWGLTQDELPAPDRRGAASLEALVHAALVAYPRYVHPDTGERCEVEALVSWMALQRQQRERFAPELVAQGFSWWKRPLVRQFLQGSHVRFIGRGDAVPAGSTLVLWGRQPVPPGLPPDHLAGVLRLEDGFLRSVGLGAALRRPLSWVVDAGGMHYDPATNSDLLALLARAHTFEPALLARAAHLRQAILAAGLTKYNVGGGVWRRPATPKAVVLVVGQVETDAAVLAGAPGVRTNIGLLQAVRQARPDAHIVWKPHPDVVAGLRAQGQGEQDAARWCEETVTDVPMDALLRAVDEVHVMTSLAGFEALLRGRPVVTWGWPFYAGRGLTQDRQPPPWAGADISLDALVAAALIKYPSYVSARSGKFTSPENVLAELQRWRAEDAAASAARRVLSQLWRQVLRAWVAMRG